VHLFARPFFCVLGRYFAFRHTVLPLQSGFAVAEAPAQDSWSFRSPGFGGNPDSPQSDQSDILAQGAVAWLISQKIWALGSMQVVEA